MNFDPRDLIDANHNLLQEAAALSSPEPAILVTVATWGRGADPDLLQALQPYRHGLGFNGSIVARIPKEQASDFLPEDACKELGDHGEGVAVFAAVFKDWTLSSL